MVISFKALSFIVKVDMAKKSNYSHPSTGAVKTFTQLVDFLKDNQERMTDHSRTCTNHTVKKNQRGECCKQQRKYRRAARR
jgi:hypothetical protein